MVGCGRDQGCHLPVQGAVAEYRESLMAECVVYVNATVHTKGSVPFPNSLEREHCNCAVLYVALSLSLSARLHVIFTLVISGLLRGLHFQLLSM